MAQFYQRSFVICEGFGFRMRDLRMRGTVLPQVSTVTYSIIFYPIHPSDKTLLSLFFKFGGRRQGGALLNLPILPQQANSHHFS